MISFSVILQTYTQHKALMLQIRSSQNLTLLSPQILKYHIEKLIYDDIHNVYTSPSSKIITCSPRLTRLN
jgi:hypothetical protein